MMVKIVTDEKGMSEEEIDLMTTAVSSPKGSGKILLYAIFLY